uniref:Peroxin-13 n=1 Tax=Mustela putorius furo TaxID=9669 RepID=M3YG80_MUSPF
MASQTPPLTPKPRELGQNSWSLARMKTCPHFQSADLGPTLLTRPGTNTYQNAPPILPRPSQQTGSSNVNAFRPAYSSFSSRYGACGNAFYGSYRPYSYGDNGLGYNRLCDDLPPRFIQQAEESSRGAFQSTEIVHVFASLSMMMDATFSAVCCFGAVLDVANHFSQLKIHFTKGFSAFALVRTIRYLYKQLQWMMNEDLWAESEGTVACLDDEGRAANSAKSRPMFLFFAIILSSPYLIWKMLSTHNDEVNMNWASGEDDHILAREYDFAAVSEEISFHAGNMLNLTSQRKQPKVHGSLLASLDGQTRLTPCNYVKSLGKKYRAVESSKISKQQQSYNATLIKVATAANSLDELESAFESVFVETNKVPVAPDPTGKGGDKQDL